MDGNKFSPGDSYSSSYFIKEDPSHLLHSQEFSPREQTVWLASGSSDNTIKIWDCVTGACCATMQGHQSRVWDLSATKQSNLLASASGDGTVKVSESIFKYKFISFQCKCISIFRYGHNKRAKRPKKILDSEKFRVSEATWATFTLLNFIPLKATLPVAVMTNSFTYLMSIQGKFCANSPATIPRYQE
jgi:hypothetical protein